MDTTSLKSLMKRWLSKFGFRDKTKLTFPIDMTEIGQYARLLNQIHRQQKFLANEHREVVSFENAAADWYKTIYRPLVAIIEKLYSLDEVYEVHSVHGDVDILVKIFLKRDLISSDAEVISDFVHNKVRKIPGIVSTQTLIAGYSKVK